MLAIAFGEAQPDASSASSSVSVTSPAFMAVIDAVRGAGGDVLKLIGDGVLAILRARSIADACSAALAAGAAMRRRIAELNDPRAAAGLPVSAPYVGLHVGDLSFGNIGSRDPLDFTVVEPAVNEASRICAMWSKLLGRR